MSIGFDARPEGRAAFDFPALTYYAERPTDRMAYITLFPIGTTMRANLFGYRDMNDPWLKQFRDAPQETLYAMWPGLRKFLGEFSVPDFIKIRPVDLYVSRKYRQDGVVLVGDAFPTSCPAAGTGARKVLVDVERLCNVHISRWLATPGMAGAKIAQFYDDPVKQACERYCLDKAYSLRSFTLDAGLPWAARRWAKFALQSVRGLTRAMTAPAPAIADDAEAAPSLAHTTPAHK